jgi:hypothetical protein
MPAFLALKRNDVASGPLSSFYVQGFLEYVPFGGGDKSKNHFLVMFDVFRGNVESPVNKGSGELCQTGRIDTFRI